VAARSTQRKVKTVFGTNSDFPKVLQVWVPSQSLPRVLCAIHEHMEWRVEGGEYKRPHIHEFVVADDRGGSGHYWLRFPDNNEGLTMHALHAIVGKEFDITLEDA